jgi:hypothetical protein
MADNSLWDSPDDGWDGDTEWDGAYSTIPALLGAGARGRLERHRPNRLRQSVKQRQDEETIILAMGMEMLFGR